MKKIIAGSILIFIIGVSFTEMRLFGPGGYDLRQFFFTFRDDTDTIMRVSTIAGVKINTRQYNNVDSLPTLTTTGSDYIMVVDATSGQFKKILASTLSGTGTYTPTLTNSLNVDASSVPGTTLYYQRAGNQVTVWGTVSIDATAGSTLTGIDISLPIASALSSTLQLSGQCNSSATGGGQGTVQGNITDDRAQLEFINGTATTSVAYTIRFSYEVL